MASLGISEFFGLWGRGWGFFNPLISRDDFRLYEMGALFGGGESTNWNMQQIQCMVEIWGDLPIRTHSLGWCHIRWPLFSRNWKMMFPKVWVFWWNMLLRSPEGKVFVGAGILGLIGFLVTWGCLTSCRTSTYFKPAEKSTFRTFAIFALLELLWVPGAVGTHNSWCASPARIDWTFQPEWFLHHTRFSNPRVVWKEHLFREDSEKPFYNCKCSP